LNPFDQYFLSVHLIQCHLYNVILNSWGVYEHLHHMSCEEEATKRAKERRAGFLQLFHKNFLLKQKLERYRVLMCKAVTVLQSVNVFVECLQKSLLTVFQISFVENNAFLCFYECSIPSQSTSSNCGNRAAKHAKPWKKDFSACIARCDHSQAYRSTSPNTMSSVPMMATMSARKWSLPMKSMAARCAKPGALILQR